MKSRCRFFGMVSCTKPLYVSNGISALNRNSIAVYAVEASGNATPREDRARLKRSRARKKAKEAKDSVKVNSTAEISKKDAKAILAERLRNAHVVEFCTDLAQTAARQNKIPFNKHLLSNGLRATLAKTTLSEIPDEEVEGEILYRRDLYALYDYGFWRQPDVSFEQWLADRRRFKSDAFELSQLLGKADFGEKHREWTRFLPRWNPVGLKPGYTQQQGLVWLAFAGVGTVIP